MAAAALTDGKRLALILSLKLKPSVTYEQLREVRRKRLKFISDEALIELDQITLLMKTMRR